MSAEPHSIERPARRGRTLHVWIVAAAVLALLVAFVRVTIVDPRVHIRWRDGVTPAERAQLERRFDLREGALVEGTSDTWRYGLGDSSRETIRTLVETPAVADTAYVDRNTFASEGRDVQISVWYPFNDLFARPSSLLQLHQSVWLLLSGGFILWSASAVTQQRRRNLTVAALAAVCVMALLLPLQPTFVTMGGSADHVRSRADFESWFGGRVRFEKHLSQMLLLQTYSRMGPAETAPEQAVIAVSRAATMWFALLALAIGAIERWSPLVVRYLGLVVMAPAALLYFGWREFGYLSLNVAAFPLLARGLKDGGSRLEAGGALAGLGAALHGSGLVALAGSSLAAFGHAGAWRERVTRMVRVVAWGTAAWLGWIALYVIVQKMAIRPDPQAAAFSSWRPWFVDELREGRLAAAIFSTTGLRDIAMSVWVTGAPLLLVGLGLWRRHSDVVRTALVYLAPSILFLILRWPFDGVGGGMDLVVAGFPALYALAWVCAHDEKRTVVAAALLMSAHYAFWRVVLDQRFQP